jgi:hypothetical protein
MTRSHRHDRLAADAFRDAVRHILAEDGVFTLADRHDRTRFWSWNGVGWREERVPIGRSPRMRAANGSLRVQPDPRAR